MMTAGNKPCFIQWILLINTIPHSSFILTLLVPAAIMVQGWVDAGHMGCSSLAAPICPTSTHQKTLFTPVKLSLIHFSQDIKVPMNPGVEILKFELVLWASDDIKPIALKIMHQPTQIILSNHQYISTSPLGQVCHKSDIPDEIFATVPIDGPWPILQQNTVLAHWDKHITKLLALTKKVLVHNVFQSHNWQLLLALRASNIRKSPALTKVYSMLKEYWWMQGGGGHKYCEGVCVKTLFLLLEWGHINYPTKHIFPPEEHTLRIPPPSTLYPSQIQLSVSIAIQVAVRVGGGGHKL